MKWSSSKLSVKYFSHGQMNSWCGIQRILTKSNKFPCPQQTSGFLTFSSMSCKGCHCSDFSILAFNFNLPVYQTDHTDMVAVCFLPPEASMWESLQIFLMSMLHMRGWCKITSPSRLSLPAHSTSTTSRLMFRSAALPSRAGSIPVSTHSPTWDE